MSARILYSALLLCLAAVTLAADKKPPAGEASNDDVSLQATVLDPEQIQQIFASDFNKMFVVVEVTLTPKTGKSVDVHLDDFLIRSEQTGEHSGPLSASQIGGQGSMVVNRGQSGQKRGGFGGGFGGIMMGGGGMGAPTIQDNTKVTVKEDTEKDPLLAMLKRKILAEKTITEPVTGLLFFPLEKEKPKNLALIYTTPAGKLRFKFK